MKLKLRAGEYELTLQGFAPWCYWLAKKMDVSFHPPVGEEKDDNDG